MLEKGCSLRFVAGVEGSSKSSTTGTKEIAELRKDRLVSKNL